MGIVFYRMNIIYDYFPIAECTNSKDREPIIGLSDFLAGAIASAMQQNDTAINAFQLCNRRREKINDNFMHISVLSHVELAQLLLQCDKSVCITNCD